jgi:energy-coupling factor transporter ATP-binding protein EcfA2
MFLNAMEGESLPELPPAEDFGIPLYAWESVITEACGLLICGNSGLGKTSIAKLIAGILTSQKPARVLVCDPHANKNKWEEAGLKAIYDYKEIEQTLYWAELELNRRREPGAEPGERFILILDELGECFDYFEDVERIKRIIRQLGTRSRKYDACAIILNHSDNCAAIGLDGKYRDNYLQISLGALARKRFKKGTPELAFLETQAYPCAVGGPVPWICAKHPTHGDYTEFQTEGLPPLVTLPINQIKAMAPTASENNHHGIKLENRPQNEAKIQNLNPLEALEKAYAMPIVLSEAEEKLLLIAAQYGSIHGREVMRALHLDNMEMVRSLFAKWEECGIGRSFPTEKGSVEFRVIAEDDKK